jgi:hypothetical protein
VSLPSGDAYYRKSPTDTEGVLNAKASELVIDLAQALMEFMVETQPGWRKAFFKFHRFKTHWGSNGSYVLDSGVFLFNPIKHSAFSDKMNDLGLQLMKALDKPEGLFLLVVKAADLSYEIHFEFDNLERWKITKEDDDDTGLPEGFEA